MAVSKVKPKSRISFCNNCKRQYPIDEFFETTNKFHANGVMLYCKDCCEEITKYYLSKTEQLESAMWITCSVLGFPFIKKVYEDFEKRIQSFQSKSNKEYKEYNLFANYYYCFKNSIKPTGINWDDFSDTDTQLNGIASAKKSEELIKMKIEEYQLKWGYHEEVEDYQFLESNYDRYTQHVEDMRPQQEDLYRDLCLARLKKRKIDEGKDSTENTKEIQNRILQLMNKLNIDEFESNKPKTFAEQTLFAKIAQCDQNNVQDIYKEPTKYYDHNKLLKYEKDMVLRPLGNTLLGHRDFDVNLEDLEAYNLE